MTAVLEVVENHGSGCGDFRVGYLLKEPGRTLTLTLLSQARERLTLIPWTRL